MNGDTAPYYAYLLRFWRERGPAWRFSLEDPRTGARRGFAGLAELIAYLEGQISDRDRASSPCPVQGDET